MLVLIKGAGDLATGTAVRLYRAGIPVVMTEVAQPTAVRRTVAFSQCMYDGAAQVEGISARRAEIPSTCLLYTSPSPRDVEESRMPSSA